MAGLSSTKKPLGIDCPLCGQPLPSLELIHTPDFAVLVKNNEVAKLSWGEAAIFRILYTDRNKGVPLKNLVTQFYAGGQQPLSATQSVYAIMNKLKHKVARIGLKVISVKYGVYTVYGKCDS